MQIKHKQYGMYLRRCVLMSILADRILKSTAITERLETGNPCALRGINLILHSLSQTLLAKQGRSSLISVGCLFVKWYLIKCDPAVLHPLRSTLPRSPEEVLVSSVKQGQSQLVAHILVNI